MDIEEYKKFVKDKIESETLTKKVRNIIKETEWQKQDMREGFKETFNPLIKSQDSIKKSIDEQQNKTLAQLQANQLALTQGLNQNRMAITQGLENLIAETPKEYEEPSGEPSEKPSGEPSGEQSGEPSGAKGKIATFNKEDFNKYLNNKERIDILESFGYDKLPYDFLGDDTSDVKKIIDDINEQKEEILNNVKNSVYIYTNTEGYTLMKPKSTNPHKKTKVNIDNYNTLSTFSTNLSKALQYKLKIGKGMTIFNNTYNLIKRLELLAASINAGNNGAMQEFSQIAHLLKQMNVISNKQLNDLLKTYLTII